MCHEYTNKPILLFFTLSHTEPTRGAYWEALNHNHIRQLVSDEFVFTVLYVDDPTPLTGEEMYYNELIKTKGGKNADFQIKQYQHNAGGFYVIVDSYFNELARLGLTASTHFETFLQEGLAKFEQETKYK